MLLEGYRLTPGGGFIFGETQDRPPRVLLPTRVA